MTLMLCQKEILVNNQTLANRKKVPVIPPILVNNKLLTNFKDKVSIFNDFFSKQCQPVPWNYNTHRNNM